MAEYSKGEVSRAGKHLAARLIEVRNGTRDHVVDESDADDVRARAAVEWWRAVHDGPMLAVREVVRGAARDREDAPKRFDTMIDKLAREPGKLTD